MYFNLDLSNKIKLFLKYCIFDDLFLYILYHLISTNNLYPIVVFIIPYIIYKNNLNFNWLKNSI